MIPPQMHIKQKSIMKGDIMKNTFKRLTAALFSAAVAASLGMSSIPASYAEGETYSIPVSKATNDEATHEYVAYQVFTGTLATISGQKQLTEIQWGSGVNSTSLLTALTSSTKFGSTNPFSSCTTAAEVALVIESFTKNSPEANAFADIVSANLSTTSYSLSTQKVPGAGYYFVKDTITEKPSTNSQYAFSDHILSVVTDHDLDTIKAKTDVPFIDKKIGTDYASGKNTNTASIGDKVPFVLESAVPDMSAYNDYYFIINDTMSQGLTFNNDVTITVGSYTLTSGTDYEVLTTGVSPYTFQIVFKDFYEQLYQMGTEDPNDDGGHIGETITVKYSATLNEKADLSSAGNPNKVDLTFSNNPNHQYNGGDKPTGDEKNNTDVIGKTPESTTKTFTTGLKLIKKDATTKAALEGAKFKITGEGVKAVLINDKIYKEAADGTYYMLKDGTFTDEASTEATASKYDSTTVKYKLISSVTHDTATTTESVNQTAYSDANGFISFTGLKEGTYTISELAAPDGYNKLSENITIVISSALDDTAQTCTWTAKKGSDNISNKNNLFTFDVENNKGMTLPGTGGMGTTIFYVVGGMLVAGALVLLIVKKRMNIKER